MIFLKNTLLIICFLLCLQSCFLQRYQVRKKTEKVIRSDEPFLSSHTGLIVYDPATGKELLNINGNKFFTPASNIKILTFYASSKILKDSIPSILCCIQNDSLYFTGLGDPTFLHPDFKNQPVFSRLSKTEHTLVYIPQFYSGKRFGPGWSWDDFPYYYSAEKSSFPIYGNMIWIKKDQSDSIIQIIPKVFDDQVTIEEDENLRDSILQLERAEFYNRFYLAYNHLPDSLEEVIPFNYSDELFVYLLSDTLKKSVFIKDFFPDCNRNIQYSVHIDRIIKPFLTYSNNFFGEQLLMQSSWKLNDTLFTGSAIHYVKEKYFNSFKDQIYWVDGSGLSRYNQVTPAAMVKLLEMIYREFSEGYIKSILPAGGVSGTLKNSFKSEEPYIFAKTGSMSNVYNVSGYLITQSGRWLIFSFMNNNVKATFTDLPRQMELILRRIYMTY